MIHPSRLRLIALFLLLTPATLQLRCQTSGFRIAGQVLNARDDAPVRHCHMSASISGPGRGASREPVQTDTDETGHFLLDLPAAGKWTLSASAHNFRPQQFEEHEGFFSGIVLTPAKPSYALVFHAQPDAILHGTVTDEAGEPVRNAQISLFRVDPSAMQSGGKALQQRQATQADDRGQYEIASLDPGTYIVQVQARPWYSSANGTFGGLPPPAPDPLLDVVYPITWYPGVQDRAAAEHLTARPGDSLRADLRIVPIPPAHVLIPSSNPPTDTNNPLGNHGPRPQQQDPHIQMISADGTMRPVFGPIARDPFGNIDMGGLSPGNYQITLPPQEPGGQATTSSFHISNAGATVEVGRVTSTAPVTISVDGSTSATAAQIELRSLTSGQSFSSSEGFGPEGRNFGQPNSTLIGPPTRGRPSGLRTRGDRSASAAEQITLQVPPGSYEVSVFGESSVYMTGLRVKGASSTGRMITVSDQPVALNVHLATGYAAVDGISMTDGSPAVGAMVLLVPISLGDPATFTIVHRDQTNTDGSFHLDRVIPGQYILLAIDHGWSIHWTDPQVLAPYLMRGIPLDLKPSAHPAIKLSALAP